jgi:predicted NAD/FAD-binding protein
MLRDVPRFHRAARRLLGGEGEKASLRDWLCGAGFSREFVEHYAVPMAAAIWSAAPGECLDIPAATFARFFENHGLLALRPRIRWRTIVGGSRRYLDALAAPFRHRIRTSTPVLGVRRRRGAVEVVTAEGRRRFDRVLVATHGDQALRLLLDPSDAERRVLGAMRTRENEALLHTDPSLMPRRRRAWASWNHRIPAGPREGVLVTYHMNRLQGIRSRQPLFVTLNGSDRVDPARALARLRYRHPVLDAGAIAAQGLRAHVDGVDRVHFCGAYWGYGFHEDGVRSALDACAGLGGSL